MRITQPTKRVVQAIVQGVLARADRSLSAGGLRPRRVARRGAWFVIFAGR